MESSSAPIQDLSVIIPHAKEVVLALQTWMEDVETLSPPSKALHEEANAKFEQLLARMKSNLHARNISRADKAWDEVMRQSHSRQAEQHAFRDKRLKQQKNLLQMKSLFDKLIEQGRLVDLAGIVSEPLRDGSESQPTPPGSPQANQETVTIPDTEPDLYSATPPEVQDEVPSTPPPAETTAAPPVQSRSGDKRGRPTETAQASPSKRPRISRQIDFEEVYQDGKAEIKYMIVQHKVEEADLPPNSEHPAGEFWVFRCTRHNFHCSHANPGGGGRLWQSAKGHLRGVGHEYKFTKNQDVIKELGVSVLNCTPDLLKKNNDAVAQAIKEHLFIPLTWAKSRGSANQGPTSANKDRSRGSKPNPEPSRDDSDDEANALPSSRARRTTPETSRGLTGEPVTKAAYTVYWTHDDFQYQDRPQGGGEKEKDRQVNRGTGTVEWFAAVSLPIYTSFAKCRLSFGDQESIWDMTDTRGRLPFAYEFDRHSKTVRGWKAAYRNGSPKAEDRPYPFLLLNSIDGLEKCRYAWVRKGDIEKLDVNQMESTHRPLLEQYQSRVNDGGSAASENIIPRSPSLSVVEHSLDRPAEAIGGNNTIQQISQPPQGQVNGAVESRLGGQERTRVLRYESPDLDDVLRRIESDFPSDSDQDMDTNNHHLNHVDGLVDFPIILGGNEERELQNQNPRAPHARMNSTPAPDALRGFTPRRSEFGTL